MLIHIKFDGEQNAWKGKKTKSVTLSILILNMQVDCYRMGKLVVTGNECCEEVGSSGFLYTRIQYQFWECRILFLHNHIN